MNADTLNKAADTLAAMYGQAFGGKASGRFRIPRKLVGELMGRRRIYPEDVQALTREVLERGFVLIDMESFFVVLNTNSFVNYRRANQDCLAAS